MGNVVGKSLAGAAFATFATWAAAMPVSAQNLTIHFSGPPILIDAYNEVLGMVMPPPGESLFLEVRYADGTVQFSGEPVELDPFNEALGIMSLSFMQFDNPFSAFALMPGDGGPRLWEGLVPFETK